MEKKISTFGCSNPAIKGNICPTGYGKCESCKWLQATYSDGSTAVGRDIPAETQTAYHLFEN